VDTLTLEVEGGIFFKTSGIAKLQLSIKTKMANILNINVMETSRSHKLEYSTWRGNLD
jgi:hypothetical protein